MGKKFFKQLFIFLIIFLGVKISNVYAEGEVEFFDNLLDNSEFTIYTDFLHNDSASFNEVVNNTINRYSIYNYLNSVYTNYSLTIDVCDYDNSSCDFSLYKGVYENNKYTNTLLKTYDDISIIFDSNVNTYFEMLNGNNISINYDEEMFISDLEKRNYIYDFLNSFSVFDGNSSVNYSYDDFNKILYRSELYNSRVIKIVSKKIDDVVFNYEETDYSDEFKNLTTGIITIKSDSDITNNILSDYLSNFHYNNYYFTIDGNIVNNKVFIKRNTYINGKTNVLEKHLITLNRDNNINNNNFTKIGYGEYIDIYADEPVDKNSYIQNYFNAVNYSFYYDDGSYESYNELHNNNDDFAIIKYIKRNNGNIIDIQYHKSIIRFVGDSNTVSDEYQNKVGNELVINADCLDLDTINSNINGQLRALACNEDYSVCDISLFDYENQTIEIHKVNMVLDDSISLDFISSFGIKDNSIDIIMDDGKNIDNNYLYYHYYDQDTNNSLSYNCHAGKCRLSLNNYYQNRYETHEVVYNIINSNPTVDYLSKIKSEIDVYPGETDNIWSRLSSSSLFSKNKNDSNITVSNCDRTTSKCTVTIKNSDNQLELHDSIVNIKNGKSEEFNTLFPGDSIKLNSIYKDDADYISVVSMGYLLSKTKTWSYLSDYNNGKAKVNFNSLESHTMNIEFTDGNDEHQAIVEQVIDKIGNENLNITLDDLEFVNRFYYNDNQIDGAVNFNSKKFNDTLNKIIDNKHISYFFVEEGGLGNNFMVSILGRIVLFYDGIAYGTFNSNMEATLRNIIYIPDDTKDTKEDYIKAAQMRIDNYLGKNSGVVVSYSRPVENGEIDNKYMDIDEFDGNCYTISYKDSETEFLIIKDSSKMQTSTFSAIDVNNNITVNSDNANYPMNTIVAGEKLNKDKYKEILKKLGLSDADIIDINLYSPSIGDITNFEGVNFDVSLPIDISKYKGKKLYAYYIDDNGNIEEHEITLDDFMANFKTNHFSTYIISEKIDDAIIDELNPKTSDNIMFYILLLGGSIVLVTASLIYLKCKKNA